MGVSGNGAVWAVALGVLVVHALAALQQPQAYMDEIFHIPQTQAYCRGQTAHWHPMITTPPATYAPVDAAGLGACGAEEEIAAAAFANDFMSFFVMS